MDDQSVVSLRTKNKKRNLNIKELLVMMIQVRISSKLKGLRKDYTNMY